MHPEKIAVFGVPTAAGARGPGVSRAPFVLRQLGLLEALAADGRRVVNRSDLSLFPFRADPEHPTARNADVVACALRAGADEMSRSLADGFTVMLGGDATLTAALVAGASTALGVPVGLLFVGARPGPVAGVADGGYLEDIPLALSLGLGPSSLASLARGRAQDVAVLGAEVPDVARALSVPTVRAIGAVEAARQVLDALDARATVVHVDWSVVRRDEMPAVDAETPGGFTLAEAAALLRALVASRRVVALGASGYDPDRDPDGGCGRHIVDLVASALSRRPSERVR